ncbi:unnamed protein product [Prorocentrum cordatum]|uniref:Uncharacterized protein n=1 Tax=Prorocentrum cordatum TaxID=2364126 RepID=A0ABN9W617_9DINO|nr:unnamed protein product [Polarella glacialis]
MGKRGIAHVGKQQDRIQNTRRRLSGKAPADLAAAEEEPGEVADQHALLLVRPRVCKSCGRNTHEYDRHCKGSEKGTEEQERQENLRRDRASGENLMQAQHAANVSATSKNEEQRFDEAFEEGVFEELREFAASRNLEFDDEEELIYYIENTLGFECGEGETGVFGVYVVENPKGSYRFKRGVKKVASFGVKERHEDEESAKRQHMEDTAGGVGMIRGVPRHPGHAQVGVGAGASPAADKGAMLCMSISGASEFGAASGGCSMSSRSDRQQQLGLGHRRLQHASGPRRPRSDAARSSGPSPSPRTPCVASKLKASEGMDDPPTAKPKKQRQTNGHSVEGGRQLLEEVESYWGNALLWSRKYRSRDFENLLTRLSARASKTSSLDHQDASSVAEELYQLSVQLADARNFVTMLRESPESVVLQLSEAGIEFFKKIDDATVANIFSTVMLTLVAHPSADVVKLGLQVAKYRKDAPKALSLAIMGAPSDYATSVQVNIIQTFIDKVIKKNSMQDFITIMSNCSDAIGECDLDSIDTSTKLIDDATGWCPAVLADLHAIRFFAQVLAADPKDKLPRALRVMGVQLVNNKEKLSSRFRVCMRVNAGAANWAKAAFDRLPTSSSIGGADDCVLQESVVKSVQQLTASLEDTCGRLDNQNGIAVLWELIGGMAADDEIIGSIEAFSRYFDGLDDNDDTKDPAYTEHVALKDKFVRQLCNSTSHILTHYSNFSMDLDGIYNGVTLEVDTGCESADDADPFKVLSHVAWCILLFDIPPPARATIKEMKSRCDVIVKVNCVKIQSGQKPVESSMTQWSDVWQEESVINCAPKLPSDSDEHFYASHFEAFNKAVCCRPASQPILDYVRHVAASENCAKATPKFLQVTSEIKDALPPAVQDHVAAVRAYNLIRSTATACLQGKLVGCMQAASVLKSCADVVAPVGDKKELAEWKQVLIGEWGKRFKDILKKVDLSSTQAFVKKYGPDGENILALISAWDFGGEGKQSWLASPTRDAAKEQEMKAVESFAMSFGPAERALEDLKVARSSLHWLDPVLANRLDEGIATLPEARALKKTAAVLMCSIVLCNACLTGIGKNEARKYVAEKVMVNLADLPPKLTEALESEGSTSASASASAAAATVSGTSGAEGTSSAEAALEASATKPPKKAFKAPKCPGSA